MPTEIRFDSFGRFLLPKDENNKHREKVGNKGLWPKYLPLNGERPEKFWRWGLTFKISSAGLFNFQFSSFQFSDNSGILIPEKKVLTPSFFLLKK